ncbi:MAG: hypothetical protein IK062_00785 [Selenomonadaceae bacterium]|nr:hypothetical protein [Selenomonadaceae bacterium]
MGYEVLTDQGFEVQVSQNSSYVDETALKIGDEGIVLAALPDNWVEQMVDAVNAERSKAGLDPLTVSDQIMQAAQTRAEELPTYFSHTRPDGTDCFTALTEAGYSYTAARENIAAGQTDVASVMESWMNSSGHRENILATDVTEIGVGAVDTTGAQYENYWVQMFGSSDGSTSGGNGNKNNGSNNNGSNNSHGTTPSNSTYFSDSVPNYARYSNGAYVVVNNVVLVTPYFEGQLWVEDIGFDSKSYVVDLRNQNNTFYAGDANENKIIDVSSGGCSTLWGGQGMVSDTLIGGESSQTFLFGKYDGNDVIWGANSNDTINLYNVSVSDIGGVSVDGEGGAYFEFAGTGSSLYVKDIGNDLTATVKLADGSAYQYNRASGQLVQVG